MASENFEKLPGLDQSYDQIRKMAIGGMAELYRGRQRNLDRPVAIKRIRPELRTNKDIQERFKREARASANLLHQNLAHVYDYCTVAEDAYIIMEWIDGFDLAEILERGPIPLDVACMIAHKVLVGLSHVHAHGMVHRDIKPDNIRVSARGEIKIMDFGIAFDPSESNLTMPGVLIGSPHYLSPEQVTGARLDGRADLFSFGITFYEMLTNKRPFVESKQESVYTKIQKGVYVPADQVRPDVPSFLTKIVENCLQVNPAHRPASANRVAVSLQEYILRNYSLNSEARIRQFLIEGNFLPGTPELIEIEERTLDPSVQIPANLAPPASPSASTSLPVDYQKESQGAGLKKILMALFFVLVIVAIFYLIKFLLPNNSGQGFLGLGSPPEVSSPPSNSPTPVK